MTKMEVVKNFMGRSNFFQNPAGDFFAQFEQDGVELTVPINETQFGSTLNKEVFEHSGSFLKEKDIKDVIVQGRGLASVSGVVNTVSYRVAESDGNVIVDLCRTDGKCVLVTDMGWSIIDRPPQGVFFVRPRGMLALPIPEKGGNIEQLTSLINLTDERMIQLLITQIVGFLYPKGPYPIMMLNGGPGTAKSTMTKMIKTLIDPSGVPLRNLPKAERDFIIGAANGHVLAFDNVSHMSPDLSDVCCKIATGAGFSTRRLFTDDDEKHFNVMRPMIFNGIPDFFSSRSDLADRSIHYVLKPIPAEKRLSSDSIEQEFSRALPLILGVLFEALSFGIRNRPYVRLKRRPRMADYAEFVTGVECYFGWELGSTIRLIEENRLESETIVLENCIYAEFLLQRLLHGSQTKWSGTATELLDKMDEGLKDEKKSRQLPQSPSSLSASLRRFSGAFASAGLLIDCDGKTSGPNSKRFISIEKITPAKTNHVYIDVWDSDEDYPQGDKKCFSNKEVLQQNEESCVSCNIFMFCSKVVRHKVEQQEIHKELGISDKDEKEDENVSLH